MFKNLLFIGFLATTCHASDQGIDTERIEQIIHVKGVWNAEEGVFKVSLPRTDIQVVIDDWTMPPFM